MTDMKKAGDYKNIEGFLHATSTGKGVKEDALTKIGIIRDEAKMGQMDIGNLVEFIHTKLGKNAKTIGALVVKCVQKDKAAILELKALILEFVKLGNPKSKITINSKIINQLRIIFQRYIIGKMLGKKESSITMLKLGSKFFNITLGLERKVVLPKALKDLASLTSP